MRTGSKAPSFQQIEAITDFMHIMPETESNILKFKAMLKALGGGITLLPSYQNDNEKTSGNSAGIVHITIAGKAFNAKKLKTNFLQCILDIDPNQLIGEYYTSTSAYTLQLLTPLRISIKNRNIEMVNAVLNHPIFVNYTKSATKASCDQLFRAYMWALRWYDETGTEEAMWAMTSRQGCTREENSLMLANQKSILSTLLEHCKAAMVTARSQNIPMLPKQIIQTFLFDGIAGEFFSSNKPYLLETQAEKTIELCKAYYPTPEELETATNKRHLISPEAIIQLVNLRLSVFENETDENIQKFKKSLNSISTSLGHDLFTKYLSITGRANSDKKFHTVTLCEFARVNRKPEFARCIDEAEAASKEASAAAAEANRLQQHVIVAPTLPIALATAATPENSQELNSTIRFNFGALLAVISKHTLSSSAITDGVPEGSGPGKGK